MLQRFTDHVIRDPLRDDDLGPRGITNHESTGRTLGRGIDSLGRAALTAGLPLLGAGAGYILGHGDHMAVAEGAGLGGLGSLGMLAGTAVARPLVDLSAGGAIGGYIGRKLDQRLPRQNHMVQKIRDMSPEHGLAYIQHAEHSGSEEPHVIQLMKDAYNARRIGLNEQFKTSGILYDISFSDPMDNDTAPNGVYDYHRPGKHIGGALGTAASIAVPAIAGGMMGGPIGAGLGALAGIPLAAVGHEVGKHVGKSIGSLAKHFQPVTNHAVEQIKQMNPQDAYVYMRNLERAGNTEPEILKAMKDAYNYRRDGLALQARAGVGQ